MINFAIGFVIGAVAAVISPPVFRYVADKVAQLRARFTL